jgi:putative peptidoglycan lipid II flippase
MEPSAASSATPGLWARLAGKFQPSHEHSALSATLLLTAAVMLSRVIGYVREMYIAWQFGATGQTDVFVAAFTLPDWLNYFLAGGTASITFISIYSRFLAQNKEEEAQKTFSVIVTVMTTMLVVGVALAEIFTPEILRWWLKDFTPERIAACTYLTRILLPAQLFFYVGGVISAILQSRRLFLFPALAPLIYNVFIILGGVLLARPLGISSLAYGALAGAFLGPFLVNAFGASKIGTGYRISFAVNNAAFREWVRLSIPLMLGVSLVTADDWILRRIASGDVGGISLLNYAKRLFAVPIAVLGQAAGQASLPFFARLFGERKTDEFAATVNATVYRIVALSLLTTALMMSAALPLVDLLMRRGRFTFVNAQEVAVYLFWFSLSLAFWAAQGLYARAFYAAGDTLTPMVAATLITVATYPFYRYLYGRYSLTGLALASDFGIAANTIALAILLHWRGLVKTSGLRWKELFKAGTVAVLAGVTSFYVARAFPVEGRRISDLAAIVLATLTWAAAVAGGLWLLKSDLPDVLQRRGRATGDRPDSPTPAS